MIHDVRVLRITIHLARTCAAGLYKYTDGRLPDDHNLKKICVTVPAPHALFVWLTRSVTFSVSTDASLSGPCVSSRSYDASYASRRSSPFVESGPWCRDLMCFTVSLASSSGVWSERSACANGYVSKLWRMENGVARTLMAASEALARYWFQPGGIPNGRGRLVLLLPQVALLLHLEDLQLLLECDADHIRGEERTSGSLSCSVLEYRFATTTVRDTGASAARRSAERVAMEYMAAFE